MSRHFAPDHDVFKRDYVHKRDNSGLNMPEMRVQNVNGFFSNLIAPNRKRPKRCTVQFLDKTEKKRRKLDVMEKQLERLMGKIDQQRVALNEARVPQHTYDGANVANQATTAVNQPAEEEKNGVTPANLSNQTMIMTGNIES